MSEAGELRRAITAALRRLEAGGPTNTEEARRLLGEALAIPRDERRETTGLDYRGG